MECKWSAGSLMVLKRSVPLLKPPFFSSHFRAIKESNLKVSFKQSINASPFTSNCAFPGLLFQLLEISLTERTPQSLGVSAAMLGTPKSSTKECVFSSGIRQVQVEITRRINGREEPFRL